MSFPATLLFYGDRWSHICPGHLLTETRHKIGPGRPVSLKPVIPPASDRLQDRKEPSGLAEPHGC
jgi:hypothetical protein